MTCRTLVAGCLASLASTLALASPSAAQSGRDLPPRASREVIEAERLAPVRRVDAVPVAAYSRDLPSFGRGLVGIARQATAVYSYDDDDFEGFYRLVDEDTQEIFHEMEFAQRFRLSESGRVEYVVACMGRSRDDTSGDAAFTLNFYRGAGTVPATLLADYDVPARLEEPGTALCFEIGGAVERLDLAAGQVWVAVSWRRGTPPENTKLMGIDEDGSGGARALRFRPEEGDDWRNWQQDTDPGVYGIRLVVNHPDPEPEPDPEPDPTPDPPPDPGPDPDPDAGPPTGEGYTDCVPETTPLVFDGYNVRVCYETGGGAVGEAKAGIWASGESGLLWFFNRDNAEVLVKVLNGCHINNHRWVYVAPVTDLAFNLYVVDSEGRAWSHHNRQGDTASTRSDNEAFPCGNY